MRQQGICGATRAKKRFTTKSDSAHVRAPDLVNRDFTASRPDALWVADFTYCSTWSGVVYVAFIIDVYSRRLVGWKAARSMTTALVLDALNMAAWTRRHTSLDGLICHTDAGSQYTSVLYTDRIDEVGAAPSIGTVGDSFDNAMAESVMGIFKTELHRNPAALAANGGPWKGLDDLEIATCALGVVVQRGAAALGTRRPDAGRGRSRVPSQVSARCGMREPNQRVSGKLRPIQADCRGVLGEELPPLLEGPVGPDAE